MSISQTLQIQVVSIFFFLTLFNFVSHGQDFTYSPVNSAFGGNALNYNWMLNSANLQNSFEEPSDSPASQQRSALDSFTQSLERQLLNQISREIFSSQFGSNGLEEGTFQFGNFQVDVTPGVDGLIISINDFGTGGSTQITVPYF